MRLKVVARPGLSRYAGPTRRQLIVSRVLPVAVPLVFKALDVAGLHYTSVFYFLAALLLLLSARAFLQTGTGLGILVLIQLFASVLATAVLAVYVASGDDWLKYSGITLLMMGFVSYVFNVLGSFLPR